MSAPSKPRPAHDACGCTHNGHAWLRLCERHERENADLHARAMVEYRQRSTIPKEIQS